MKMHMSIMLKDVNQLAEKLSTLPPIEQGGSHAIKGFSFQASCAIDKIIELHKSASKYVLFFDHHNDIVIVNEHGYTFIQVKSTTEKTVFKWSDLMERGGSGHSFLSKLYECALRFSDDLQEIVLLANKPFLLKNGRKAKTDKVEENVRLSDLPKEFASEYRSHIGEVHNQLMMTLNFCVLSEAKTILKKTDLHSKSHIQTMQGMTAEWLEGIGYSGTDEQRAFYKSLRCEIEKRGEMVLGAGDRAERKSLSREIIDQLIGGLCKSNHTQLREKSKLQLEANSYSQLYVFSANKILNQYAVVDATSPGRVEIHAFRDEAEKWLDGMLDRKIEYKDKKELIGAMKEALGYYIKPLSLPVMSVDIILMYEVVRAQDK